MCKLLTREEFNSLVLKRDGHKCVICGSTNELDVHHITDRKCFDDGGYYIDNGITLCGGQNKTSCHYKAEIGEYTPYFLRYSANISNLIYPPTMDVNIHPYNKWGEIICDDCQILQQLETKATYLIQNKSGLQVGMCEDCLLEQLIGNENIQYKKI